MQDMNIIQNQQNELIVDENSIETIKVKKFGLNIEFIKHFNDKSDIDG